MKNDVQNGDYIEFTAGATITSGQLVQVGSLHGVSVTDVANGAKGTLAMEGVFTLPKLTAAAGDACTAGGPGISAPAVCPVLTAPAPASWWATP